MILNGLKKKKAHNQSSENQDVVKTASGSALTMKLRNVGMRKRKKGGVKTQTRPVTAVLPNVATPSSAFPFMSSSSVGMTVTGSDRISPTRRASCCSAFLDLRRFRDLFSILLLAGGRVGGGGGSLLHRVGSCPFMEGALLKDSSDSVEAELSELPSDTQSLDEQVDA